MSSALARFEEVSTEEAMKGFAELMAHVLGLYTLGESWSVSELEGHEIAESVLYVLGMRGEDDTACLKALSSGNVVKTWTERRCALEARIPEVLDLWREVVATMPPIHNIALRDTLISIEGLPRVYDTFFAAHEVPCDIDYPLAAPVSEDLAGLDYLEAWLAQLLVEARFLAHFDAAAMEAYLDSWCLDFRGLLINLYEPIREAWARGDLAMRSPQGLCRSR